MHRYHHQYAPEKRVRLAECGVTKEKAALERMTMARLPK
jgi:hypothetical protein